MKKIVLVTTLIAVVLVGYVAAGPFITLHKMKSAAKNQQIGKLAETIDFPKLRVNLKNQMNEKLSQTTRELTGSSELASVTSSLLSNSSTGDKVVNQLVAPIVITRLMDGLEASKEVIKPTDASEVASTKPFEHIRWSYDSPSLFSVWVKPKKANIGETRFVLEREGLTWKLTNIILPFS